MSAQPCSGVDVRPGSSGLGLVNLFLPDAHGRSVRVTDYGRILQNLELNVGTATQVDAFQRPKQGWACIHIEQ